MGAGSRVQRRYVLRYYNRHKEYGGLKAEQAEKQKDLARENQRMKKLAADLSIDRRWRSMGHRYTPMKEPRSLSSM